MNYQLTTKQSDQKPITIWVAVRKLVPLLASERKHIVIALGAVTITSAITLAAPYIIAHIIDTSIQKGSYQGVLIYGLQLLGLFIIAFFTSTIQTKNMGAVGRNVLFKLRNQLFSKLQSLPIAFFNQNKSGDLISRINNDTDQLNIFFSQGLVQLMGGLAMIVGAAVLLLVADVRVGAVALVPAIVILVITQIISPWVRRRNRASLKSLGELSAEIQESLENFKVVVAFNRQDYFRNRFDAANRENYRAYTRSGFASNIFMPLYGLASNIGQAAALLYGVYSIARGSLTIGLLVGILLYVYNFYMPLRQLAVTWSTMQLALAGLDRVSEILAMESNMKTIEDTTVGDVSSGAPLLEFRNVSFAYNDEKTVLRDISLKLYQRQTYALVGPTGGGKTTTAGLMARLFDPIGGEIYLEGRDLRSLSDKERTDRIGFILQEPFLFAGTVRDNIVYGNQEYIDISESDSLKELEDIGLAGLLVRFPEGLATAVSGSGDGLSLGQRQLVAFIRAVFRKPDILILDEATANIDTVTEELLEEILARLPSKTTKIIIAHRLNTIQNADEIFFVNAGRITNAGSMEQAVDMLMHSKRTS